MEYFRERIEKTRERIHRLVNEKGFDHPDVLQLSKVMDQMLNEYDNLVNKGKNEASPPPNKYIRIIPNGSGYTMVLNDRSNVEVLGQADSFDDAKTLAFSRSDNFEIPVFYLEQKLKDK
ncbi:aspartyl-phosphate phosphatase Spo0E family protein [Paenibacillus senegalimassiliensis]|uniref:aspartyl-phosphate phosphatase Spo0E family protein n=1 Tax=Paenibacillus senegalimassiliensis TaxID=1737426 RepID=UPI00073E9CB9|nr:aspartyl-phosphate phosphatase Spo0E family protein [Paenibacillus senegalimassiliensis]